MKARDISFLINPITPAEENQYYCSDTPPWVKFQSNFRVEKPAVNQVDMVFYIPLIGLF